MQRGGADVQDHMVPVLVQYNMCITSDSDDDESQVPAYLRCLPKVPA